MTGRKYRADGSLVPRQYRPDGPDLTDEEKAAFDAFTDTLPEPLRAFRDLNFLSDRRRHRIEEVIQARTRTLVVVLHGVHDPHNQAAVLRTCEAMGLQELHVVETPHAKLSRRVTQAAHKWTEVHRYPDFETCAKALRDRGFTLHAATLAEDAVSLESVDCLKPTALVLGNEALGLPDEVVAACDGAYLIPMTGFTQSLNISVAASMSIYEGLRQRRGAWGKTGDLTPGEIDRLRRTFYRRAAGRIPRSLVEQLEVE